MFPSSSAAATARSRVDDTQSDAFQLDDMECALDGVATPAAASIAATLAVQRADSDPEQIMLSLRGLPIFPNPPNESEANHTPEAAFIVAGGPTCLLREVLLAPYPHPEAPRQIYATIDAARRAQNISDFKPAIRALRSVLLVWKKKHLWSVLRAHPSMSLTEGLADEVRRASERAERAIYKAAEKERREEEEREFARKMAEQGEGADGDADHTSMPAPVSLAPDGHKHGHDDDEDSESDWENADEEEDEMDEAERQERRRRRKAHKVETVHNEAPVEVSKHEQPEEVLEFPSVTPEEELEFLTFYYNALGAIYQSAGAACESSGQIGGMNAPGVDGVRWGKMKVIPCAADSQPIRIMMEGTKAGAVVATAVTQPSYAANLEASILEEEELDETEEDFIASSPADLSNSSDARALIALWQAKRAHDLYVALKESEKNRAIALQREIDLAARGGKAAAGGAGGEAEEEADDSSSIGDGQSPGGVAGGNGGAQSNTHTTLGLPGFAAINIPNLSLAQLQSESKALGLFGFPHITNLPGVASSSNGNSSGSGGLITSGSTQAGQEQEQNLVFWATQPIVIPSVAAKPTESQKSLGLPALQFQAQQQAVQTANSIAAVGQKLINPYQMCSSADAVTYSNLGTTLFHLRNYPLALRCFFVALQIRCATLRPQEDEYIDVATSLNNLGVVLSQLQFHAQAWSYFSAAHELAKSRLDSVHPRLNLISNNLSKIKPRRQGILPAPGLLQELRSMAQAKEMKEYLAREKRNAKAAKKGGKGGAGNSTAKPTARKTGRPGKKDEEAPKEFHEDTRFFRPPVDGQPPIVPKPVEGAPPGPLGSAAAAIKIMPLRQFDVQMSEFGKLQLEFGAPKKKTKEGGKKGKSKKK